MAWYDRLLAVAESALDRANEALEAVVEATASEPAPRPDRQPPTQSRPRRRARESPRHRLERELAEERAARRELEKRLGAIEVQLRLEQRKRERAEATAERRKAAPPPSYPIWIIGRKRPPRSWLVGQFKSRDEAVGHYEDFIWVPDTRKSVLQYGLRDFRLFVDPYYLANHPPGYLPPPAKAG